MSNTHSNIEIRREDKGKGVMIVFHFVCEGCQAEGELHINEKEAFQQLGCPEDCGASYVMWKPADKYELKCVVCPVFEVEP